MRHKRRSYREPDDDDEDALSDNLAAVNERLDELTQQLERMARANAAIHGGAGGNDVPPPDRVADALARLDRRLDQVIAENRGTTGEHAQRGRHAPPPPQQPAPPPPSRGAATWAAQISARQRALEGGVPIGPATAPAAPAAYAPTHHAPAMHAPSIHAQSGPAPMQAAPAPMPPPANWAPGPDLSELQQQLHEINTQISSLHRPYEDGFAALRSDLGEIGRLLTEAMPRQAIEALEADVRALAERLDQTRQAGADAAALAALEAGLAEVRDALRGLTPAESLVGFEDAVHALSHKIDQIAATASPAQDPEAFKQLEQAVVSLRGVVSNVASDGALAQLAAEVHALAGQIERATADSSTEALAKLEERITALMESGRGVPPELEGSIRELSERLDRMQLSQGDQLALGALEDRIAKLSEKLDASDARLKQLDAIERGLADLLVYLEDMRSGGPRGLRAAPQAEPAEPKPPHRPEPQPDTPQAPAPAPAPASPLDLIPELPQQPPAQTVQAPEPPATEIAAPEPMPPAPPPPAPIEVAAPHPPPPPPPARGPDFTPPQSRAAPRARERQPIDPNLPPDTPLEPGSGTPRPRPGSPAARIAASEAALGHARPMAAESGGKAAAIAAARNAAKAAYLDTPVKVPGSMRGTRGWFKWPSRKARKATPLPPPPPRPPEPAYDDMAEAPPSRGKRVRGLLKKLVIAASVAIIVIGAVQTAIELLLPINPSAPPTVETPDGTAAPGAPRRTMPTPQGAVPQPPAADPRPTGQIPRTPSFFDPSTVVAPKPPPADVTGSIGRPTATEHLPIPVARPTGRAAPAAPATATSATLSAALSRNDPAAAYEMGARHAEGRDGVRQDLQEAARWLERAAGAGFAPAQFRLAGLNEKGEGLKKDLQAARRLYIAAASKGHAKAMHNLAVLYAEGIDGKPDYRVAAQWFRKAAAFGIADSQYNLAILYARGIGVETNLAESYKWFALAAAKGDRDAAQKRDEVAARLDRQTLMAAKLAVQTFVAEQEPEEAISLRAPPGGWDRAQPHTAKAQPRKPRRQHRE